MADLLPEGECGGRTPIEEELDAEGVHDGEEEVVTARARPGL